MECAKTRNKVLSWGTQFTQQLKVERYIAREARFARFARAGGSPADEGGGWGGTPPQFPGRAAENFFLRVHFHKRKKFRGRRFQDKSKTCTSSRMLGGSWEQSSIKELKLHLHSASKGLTKTNQNAKNLKIEPSLGIKWPHKNKPKRRKAQD